MERIVMIAPSVLATRSPLCGTLATAGATLVGTDRYGRPEDVGLEC